MTYTPEPIDTGDVDIPDNLITLVETLAENVHDVWAQGRIRDGWSYGEQRDDNQKEHPCLLPYGALPFSEQEYDRAVVAATIKAIIKLGYSITRN